MGASSWHYFTPHRPDPETALQELRRDVFARRDYSMGFGGFARADGTAHPALPGGLPFDPAQMLAAGRRFDNALQRILRAAQSGDFTGLNPDERRAAEELRTMFTSGAPDDEDDDQGDFEDDGPDFAPGHQPGTIEELLEMVAEDGTHSILDIEHIGVRGEFGVAAPLPPRQVRRYFGAEQPTREQVEANWDAVADELDRWEAYYVTVYRDGRPHEYAFIGCSGD